MRKRSKTAKRIAKAAKITLLCANLMLANKATAEQTQTPKTFSTRFMAGAYSKGKTPFAGLGASGQLGLKRVRVDVALDAIFPEFKNAELDHAELGITFPINQCFAFTPFIYRSQYFGGIPFSAGVAFHIPKLNLHLAPHWIYGNNALPLPVSWTPHLGDVDLMFKVIVHTLHPIMSRPAPFIGAEIKFSIKLVNNIKAFGKSFLMSARDKQGKMSAGAANSQGGLEFGF